jgi:hypothetical protein
MKKLFTRIRIWGIAKFLKYQWSKRLSELAKLFKDYLAIASAILVVVVLPVVWWVVPSEQVTRFFNGENGKKSLAEILTYSGAIAGGILFLANARENARRNNLMEKGQLDIRFKDAATLLAAKESSAILSGIFAMNQIAIEAAQDKRMNGYVGITKKIFCAILRENSKIERDKTSHKIISSERSMPLIVFQTIVDVLFREKTEEHYKLYKTDLNQTDLSEMDLIGADLRDADLKDANLIGANLIGADLRGADLRRANLYGANLSEADLYRADLSGAYLSGANLIGANLIGAKLIVAKLIVADLRGANLRGAILRGANLTDIKLDEKTNFSGTIHEGKTEDEIRQYNWREQ